MRHRRSLGVLASLLLALSSSLVSFDASAQIAVPVDDLAKGSVVATNETFSPLSLDELVRSVETSYPLLRAAEQDRVLADAESLSADGGFDPAVRGRATTIPYGGYQNDRLDFSIDQPTPLWGTRVFSGWRYGHGDFAAYDGKYQTAEYGEVRVGAQVPMWRDGPIDRRRASREKADIGRSAARYSVEEQRLVMIRAASIRYWDWVAAGRKLVIATSLLEMATKRDAQLAERVERGDLPAYERNENLRVMHQREAQVVQAERSLENASIELSLYHRSKEGVATLPDRGRLPNAIPEIDDSSTETRARLENVALADRPEPKRIAAQIAQQRVELSYAENQKRPGIDLFVMGSKDLGDGPKKIVPAELEVALILDIPILNRVNEGRRRTAEAQLAKLGEQQRYTKDRVVADVRDAESTIALAKERAAATRREVTVARTLVTSERERFDLGDSTLLLVNLREQAYAEAELREVDALLEHQRGIALLRAAVGGKRR